MILRKPYAFIIKHFRKIHILLLVLAGFIFFKSTQTLTFVKEFIDTNTYNAQIESIRSYISFFFYFLLWLAILIDGILIYVLHYKKKPWKAYLLPLCTYIYLFFVLLSTSNYFIHYGDNSTLEGIRVLSQLLQLGNFLQYAVFLLLLIRITGIDLKKFDFAHDEEYLEIREEDREEVEINIEVDKESIVRFFKKQIRHLKYLYFEHAFVFHILFTVLFVVVTGYTYYYFGILHKTYREGDTFQALSYQIHVKKSYFTATDYKGDTIQKGKDYVVVLLDVKNNGAKRFLNIDRFRLLNRGHAYAYTRLQDPAFQDLGASYHSKELKPGETISFYLVFEVDEGLSASKFVLYYQDIIGYNRLLYKKTKLKPTNLHKKEVIAKKKSDEPLSMEGIGVSKKIVTFEGFQLSDSITYSNLSCTMTYCSVISKTAFNQEGKILTVSYASLDFEGKDFVDFSSDYGRIEYKDSQGKMKTIKVKSAVEDAYIGKYLYMKVPKEIEGASSIQLVYTIRDRAYVYEMK